MHWLVWQVVIDWFGAFLLIGLARFYWSVCTRAAHFHWCSRLLHCTVPPVCPSQKFVQKLYLTRIHDIISSHTSKQNILIKNNHSPVSRHTYPSPYSQVFFSVKSILFRVLIMNELRLWSDLYLIKGRYIVVLGIPSKTSSLNDLNCLDVIPIPI